MGRICHGVLDHCLGELATDPPSCAADPADPPAVVRVSVNSAAFQCRGPIISRFLRTIAQQRRVDVSGVSHQPEAATGIRLGQLAGQFGGGPKGRL